MWSEVTGLDKETNKTVKVFFQDHVLSVSAAKRICPEHPAMAGIYGIFYARCCASISSHLTYLASLPNSGISNPMSQMQKQGPLGAKTCVCVCVVQQQGELIHVGVQGQSGQHGEFLVLKFLNLLGL